MTLWHTCAYDRGNIVMDEYLRTAQRLLRAPQNNGSRDTLNYFFGRLSRGPSK